MTYGELTNIHAYHLDRLIEFGAGTPGALGWKAEEDHDRRLAIFSQLGNFNGRSVLDVGCGHCDLYRVLSETYTRFSYTGIDQMQPFLEVANHRFANTAGVELLLGDFTEDALPCADFVVASGALSYRCAEKNFIYKMIDKLYGHCRMGFGFNLLAAVDYAEGLLVAYDPDAILAYCKTLSSRVELVNESVGNDFTLFLRKSV